MLCAFVPLLALYGRGPGLTTYVCSQALVSWMDVLSFLIVRLSMSCQSWTYTCIAICCCLCTEQDSATLKTAAGHLHGIQTHLLHQLDHSCAHDFLEAMPVSLLPSCLPNTRLRACPITKGQEEQWELMNASYTNYV